MSGAQQSLNAGQTQGQAQAKTEELAKSVRENAPCGAQGDCGGQQRQSQNPGLLQQTGDQVVNMAQGALDGVKTTLGVGGGQQKN